ncbi:MAG TPA: hypothetical protein P5087_04820 [Eubacteriales bacterium]|nr:hypothetical protein [Eubacteriales bacterium]
MKKTFVKFGAFALALILTLTVFCACGVKVGDDKAIATDPYYSEDYGNYTITVNLIIYNPDSSKAPLFSGTVELQTIRHMAYEAVEAACAAKSIEIVGLNEYSSFISTIAGVGYVENGDGTYSAWSCKINGGFSAGVGAQQLRDGDLFEIVYETAAITW